MAASKLWAYTSFAEPGSLVLEVTQSSVEATGPGPLSAPAGVISFDLVHWSATFGVNEIPQSSCLLALGRNARDVSQQAAIHTYADTLTAMLPAKVWLNPVGERSPLGEPWPDDRQLVFDGYLTGFSTRKINGQIQVVAQLVHWLIDLTFSSTLGANAHPSSVTDLLHPAVTTIKAGTGGQGKYVPQFLDKTGRYSSDRVAEDLWSTIKDFLCDIASSEDLIHFPRSQSVCTDLLSGKNDQALVALGKIEGGDATSPCFKAFEFSQALPLDTTNPRVRQNAADSISQFRLDTTMQQTFWDLLVGLYCSQYMMAVVPLVDRALVVAHTPTLQTPYDVELAPEDYVAIDLNASLNRPLRSVVIIGGVEMAAASNKNMGGEEKGGVPLPGVAGCFQPTFPVSQGTVLFRYGPPWLRQVGAESDRAGASTGATTGAAVRGATSPTAKGSASGIPTPADTLTEAAELYQRFAQVVYHEEMLRGRGGVIAGKLRFDIAPGSVVRLLGHPELFLGSGDTMATDHIAHVARVVISINGESGDAATSFQFTHLRSEAENESDRFSLTRHPLLGDAAFKGCPLIKAFSD